MDYHVPMSEPQFFVRFIRDVKPDESLHLSKAEGPFETAMQAKDVAIAMLQSLYSWGVMVCEKPGARWKDALWTAALRFEQMVGDPREEVEQAKPKKPLSPLAEEVLMLADVGDWPQLTWEADGEVYMKIGGSEDQWRRFAERDDQNLLKLAAAKLTEER